MGAGRRAPAEPSEDSRDDDTFRRLFTAIDLDSARTPTTPASEGARAGGAGGAPGWLAVMLDLRVWQVRAEGRPGVRLLGRWRGVRVEAVCSPVPRG